MQILLIFVKSSLPYFMTFLKRFLQVTKIPVTFAMPFHSDYQDEQMSLTSASLLHSQEHLNTPCNVQYASMQNLITPSFFVRGLQNILNRHFIMYMYGSVTGDL